MSIVYPHDFKRDGKQPCPSTLWRLRLCYPAGFSTGRLSLLDRGSPMHRAYRGATIWPAWYLDGKLEKRENTFNDFVDVAKALVGDGWTSAGRIAIAGRSAGGELMGAVVNSDPELWGAVIADVPFARAQYHARRRAAVDPGRVARMGNRSRIRPRSR